MNRLIRFVSILLAVSALAGCGSTSVKPAAEKRVAVQTSKGTVMLPAKYAKIINDIPDPDPKLMEPIPISDVKSPNGRAELDKLVELLSGRERQELIMAAREENKVARGLRGSIKSPEFFETAKKTDDKLKEWIQKIRKTDFRDPEIKALAKRVAGIMSIGQEMGEVLIKNEKTLMDLNETDSATDRAASIAAKEKANRAIWIVDKASAEMEKASEALGKKYSR